MKLTFDDRLLVVGSNDGTLMIWVILNTEGKFDQHLTVDSSNPNSVYKFLQAKQRQLTVSTVNARI